MIQLPTLPIKFYALAALALAVAGLIGWQQWQIHDLETDLSAEQARAADLAIKVGLATAQARTWQAAAAERTARAKAAMADAAVARQQAEARASALYTLDLPPEECHALQDLVDTARAPGPVGLRIASPGT